MEEFQYIQNDLILAPYIKENKMCFKEDVLVDIYFQLAQDDLIKVVFHDMPDISLNQFIAFLASTSNITALFVANKDGAEKIAGICWLSDIINSAGEIKKANGSFVFFKEFQIPYYTNQFGSMALNWWLNQIGFNIITGVTPSLNRLASVYVRRMGFKELGKIPAYCVLDGTVCDGVVTYINREMYKERYSNG